MTEPTTSDELWIYTGRRPRHGGGLVGTFLEPGGESVAFKCRHRTIGAVYSIPGVKRDDDGSVLKAGVDRAGFVEGPVDGDERVPAWEAEDRVAYTADEARKQEAAARKRGAERFAELTIADVAERYQRLPAAQRAALLANVVRAIGV